MAPIAPRGRGPAIANQQKIVVPEVSEHTSNVLMKLNTKLKMPTAADILQNPELIFTVFGGSNQMKKNRVKEFLEKTE